MAVTVGTRVARVVQLASHTGLRWVGGASRVPYLHYWTLREGVDSLVCFHHVFSILDPDVRRPCRAMLRVHDAGGRKLAETAIDVEARGSRMVSVRSLLGARAAGDALEGSLELDVVPPEDFRPLPRGTTDPPVVAAYFYMLYRSAAGMMTTVHSIDRAAVHRGVPAPVGRLLGMQTKLSGSWRSKRAIWSEGLREIRAVAINHAVTTRRLHLGLRAIPDGSMVVAVERPVPSRGVLSLEYRPAAPCSQGGRRGYVVVSNALATANGKPYVWVGYGAAPMSVHHG